MSYSIKIIKKPINKQELKTFLGNPFDDMVKFVVDVKQGILALGGEMHADCEEVLLNSGSHQQDLWGANIYPNKFAKERIEYTSLINIRPSANNHDMYIQNQAIRDQVKQIAEKLILFSDKNSTNAQTS